MGRGEDDGLRSQLRRRREAAGLSQQALGDRVGVTRQAVLAIEAGRRAPSTPLALRLARALSCRVEDLFTLAESEGLDAELSESLPIGARVLVGRVDERWVAHPVAGAATPADALVERSGVRPLVDAGVLEARALVAGCAPVLGLLAQLGGASASARWLPCSSHAGLELLQRRLVHAAGLHLSAPDAATHVELVRESFPGEEMILVNLTCWWQGLALPAGNPSAVLGLTDLAARTAFRFARRGSGSGAHALLERSLGPSAAFVAGPLARGHEDVAWLVSAGAADAGIAAEGPVRMAGLDFLPLAEERFDLVMRKEDAERTPLSPLLEVLSGGMFRNQVRCLPGYCSERTGERAEVR